MSTPDPAPIPMRAPTFTKPADPRCPATRLADPSLTMHPATEGVRDGRAFWCLLPVDHEGYHYGELPMGDVGKASYYWNTDPAGTPIPGPRLFHEDAYMVQRRRTDAPAQIGDTAHPFVGRREWGLNPSDDKPCVVCNIPKGAHITAGAEPPTLQSVLDEAGALVDKANKMHGRAGRFTIVLVPAEKSGK